MKTLIKANKLRWCLSRGTKLAPSGTGASKSFISGVGGELQTASLVGIGARGTWVQVQPLISDLSTQTVQTARYLQVLVW